MTTTVITDAATASASRLITIEAEPAPIVIDTAQTAVVVVDMQNDFGAEGGLLQRAGIDISMIQGAVAPTAATPDSGSESRNQGGVPKDGVPARPFGCWAAWIAKS